MIKMTILSFVRNPFYCIAITNMKSGNITSIKYLEEHNLCFHDNHCGDIRSILNQYIVSRGIKRLNINNHAWERMIMIVLKMHLFQ